MGKGSRQRPRTISNEEWDLRWNLFKGNISRSTFDRKLKRLRDKERKQK